MFGFMNKVLSKFKDESPEDKTPETHTPIPSKLSAESESYVPDSEAEYEGRSASVDAEVEMEMKECLDAIQRDLASKMDYSKATKSNVATISKREQRAKLRTRRERSREESSDSGQDSDSASQASSKDQEAPIKSGRETVVEVADAWSFEDEDEQERLASKSFGRHRVREFYRTKEQRDDARKRHLETVARRSGRHPNHRNVMSTKAHRQAWNRKSEERGGRHGAMSSLLSFQIPMQ
mmetsp:Transcript_26055/g.58390  ORF Transcript_26055/g.58390 Transcript_26055/m.58390 type:complete len:237 (+) Transcript_26055:91-801(+)